ncbi:hypothetical protein SteCoe_155 [Stentor coeruleus]|uniref:MalT-like TPR region domain-containing protein n=1 Tax=Stentor coeruleus TaxID=5963 RepID=A0A1R2D4K1_9CILI|nr:hypothetical protein SteCoe_155 [Stentor coeruleus]
MFVRNWLRGTKWLHRSIAKLPEVVSPYQQMKEVMSKALQNLSTGVNLDQSHENFAKAVDIARDIYPIYPSKIAKILADIALAYSLYSNSERALEHLQEAKAQLELVKNKDSQEVHEVFVTMAYAYFELEDFEETRKLLEPSISKHKFPDIKHQAIAFDRLAKTMYMVKDRVLAIKYSIDAVNLLKSIECRDLDYARCIQTQGLCYSLCNEYSRSKDCFEEALQILENSSEKSESLVKAQIYESYSKVCVEQGDLQEAVNKALQGNDILKTLNYNPGRMTYLENVCHNINNPESVEALVDEMLEIINEVYGNTEEAANIYGLAAECKYLNENYEESLEIAEKELNIYKQNNDLQSILESYMTICKIYLSLDDIEKAKSYIDLSEGMLKKHPSRLLQSELYYYKYYYYYKIEEDDQAEKFLEMSIQETIEDEENKDQLIQRYTELGNLCQIRTKLERAKECFDKALDLNRKHKGKDNMETAILIGNIGNVYGMMKNYEKALEMMFDSLELKQKLVGNEHHELISTYSMISSTYYMMKEYSLSLEYCEITKELVKKANGENDIELGHLYMMMGEIYGNTMNRVKAKSSYLQAKEVFVENNHQELVDHVMKKIDELDSL